MKYVWNFVQSIIVVAVLLLLIFSIYVPGQTTEPDKKAKPDLIYIAENTENILPFSRPRIYQSAPPFAAVKPRQNINKPEFSGRVFSRKLASLEKQAFELMNRKRAENGLAPLRWNDDLARVARLHSENMARYEFFSHTGLDGALVNNRADALGITRWRSIGENIAFIRGFDNPVESACEKWMLSPSHKENILDKRWKETGIGIAIASDGTYFFTQVFI
ncbi:MAG: CAP domain-containing protein, partial [Pyrinomonadaceae bacterium]